MVHQKNVEQTSFVTSFWSKFYLFDPKAYIFGNDTLSHFLFIYVDNLNTPLISFFMQIIRTHHRPLYCGQTDRLQKVYFSSVGKILFQLKSNCKLTRKNILWVLYLPLIRG